MGKLLRLLRVKLKVVGEEVEGHKYSSRTAYPKLNRKAGISFRYF